MSDFLSRLAARALGEPPALVPVVPSRWEGTGEGASPGIVEAAAERVAPPPARPSDSRPESDSEPDSAAPPRRRRAAPEAFDPHPPPADPPLRPRRPPPVDAGAAAFHTSPEAPRVAPPRDEARRDPGLPHEIEEVRVSAPAPVHSDPPAATPAAAPRRTAAAAPAPAAPFEIAEEHFLVPARRSRPAPVAREDGDDRPREVTEPVARPEVHSVTREDEGARTKEARIAAGEAPRGPAATSVTMAGSDESAGEARPTIRVTIGRIEVRAAPPPAPARPAAPAWTPPVMSLEEYLAREGRR